LTDTARELTPEEAASAARRRLGRVIAAEGAQILVLLDRNAAAAPPALGDPVFFLTAEGGAVAALITALSVPSPAGDGETGEIWVAETECLGTLRAGRFEAGAARLPSLGDEACAATEADMAALHGTQSGQGVRIPLGTLSRGGQKAGLPAEELPRGLGIFGAHGSGKSCTLVTLLRASMKARLPLRPVVIDSRGEHGASYGRAAAHLAPAPGLMPFWLLTPEELAYALAAATGPLSIAESALLRTAHAAARRAAHRRGEGGAAALSAGLSPFRLSDLTAALEQEGSLSGAAAASLHARLGAARADDRLALFFGGDGSSAALLSLARDVFGIGGGQLLSVVKTAGLPLGLDRLAVAVLARLALILGGLPGCGRDTLFVIEEAERYAGEGEAAAPSRAALEDLARLGPSRGIGLCLVTDRPSALPQAIRQALGTVIFGPLTGDADRAAAAASGPVRIASALSPQSLGAQEMVVIGRMAGPPVRLRIDDLPEAAVPRAYRLHAVAQPPAVQGEEMAAEEAAPEAGKEGRAEAA
jgi:hypothetical protein